MEFILKNDDVIGEFTIRNALSTLCSPDENVPFLNATGKRKSGIHRDGYVISKLYPQFEFSNLLYTILSFYKIGPDLRIRGNKIFLQIYENGSNTLVDKNQLFEVLENCHFAARTYNSLVNINGKMSFSEFKKQNPIFINASSYPLKFKKGPEFCIVNNDVGFFDKNGIFVVYPKDHIESGLLLLVNDDVKNKMKKNPNFINIYEYFEKIKKTTE